MLLAFIPSLLGWKQLLLPVHIILLELIVHPISAFAFENLKSHSPNGGQSLVPRATAITATLSGLLLTGFSLVSIALSNQNADFSHTRSLVLSTILFGNIGFTLVEAWPNFRSRKVGLIIAVLVTLPFVFCNTGLFSQYFHLSSISGFEFSVAFLFGITASLPTFIYRNWFLK